MRKTDGCTCPHTNQEHEPGCPAKVFVTPPIGTHLDVERGLAWAIRLAIQHDLSHDRDPTDLAIAIELLKAIRDEPEYLPTLFDRWDLEPDEARSEQEALNALT